MVDLEYRHNAAHLQAELEWIGRIVEARYRRWHGESASGELAPGALSPPTLNGRASLFSRAVAAAGLDAAERVVLGLALLPHVQPHALDGFLRRVDPSLVESPRSGDGSGPPTVETALFVLAGDDLEDRFQLLGLFEADAPLRRAGLLRLEHEDDGSLSRARLEPTPECLKLVTTGRPHRPEFGATFPAQRLTTRQRWEDLVVPADVRARIDEIRSWLRHGHTLLGEWGLGARLAPGYCCLFHGPPGTGKSMTAALLGTEPRSGASPGSGGDAAPGVGSPGSVGRDVYRVDLSLVVSKYVGETEKNLRRVFEAAAGRGWILFFDEADALFGERTRIESANDVFVRQQVAFLLQSVEEHPGVVILATNQRASLDDAFSRRFQSVIEFPMPSAAERLRIWEAAFSPRSVLEDVVDLEAVAERYELAGGSIVNVVRYASLMALEAGGNVILQQDLLRGIRREYAKHGRSL